MVFCSKQGEYKPHSGSYAFHFQSNCGVATPGATKPYDDLCLYTLILNLTQTFTITAAQPTGTIYNVSYWTVGYYSQGGTSLNIGYRFLPGGTLYIGGSANNPLAHGHPTKSTDYVYYSMTSIPQPAGVTSIEVQIIWTSGPTDSSFMANPTGIVDDISLFAYPLSHSESKSHKSHSKSFRSHSKSHRSVSHESHSQSHSKSHESSSHSKSHQSISHGSHSHSKSHKSHTHSKSHESHSYSHSKSHESSSHSKFHQSISHGSHSHSKSHKSHSHSKSHHSDSHSASHSISASHKSHSASHSKSHKSYSHSVSHKSDSKSSSHSHHSSSPPPPCTVPQDSASTSYSASSGSTCPSNHQLPPTRSCQASCNQGYFSLTPVILTCSASGVVISVSSRCNSTAAYIQNISSTLPPGTTVTITTSTGQTITISSPPVNTTAGSNVTINGGQGVNVTEPSTPGTVTVIIVGGSNNTDNGQVSGIVTVDLYNSTTGQIIPIGSIPGIIITIPINTTQVAQQQEQLKTKSSDKCVSTTLTQTCEYFNTTTHTWESDGLSTTVSPDGKSVQCKTTHLTDFAVAMRESQTHNRQCDLYTIYRNMFIFFLVVYSCLLLYSFSQLLRTMQGGKWAMKWLQFSIFGKVSGALMSRVIIISLGLSHQLSNKSPAGLIFLFSMPFVLLSCAFASLIFFWLESSQETTKVKGFLPTFRYHLLASWSYYLFIVLAMTFAVLAAGSSSTKIDSAANGGSAVIAASAFVMAIAFLYAGRRIITTAKAFSEMSKSGKQVMLKLYNMTAMSCVSFFLLGSFWLWSVANTNSLFASFQVIYSFYLLTELSAAAMLILSLRTSKKKKSPRPGSGSNVRNSQSGIHDKIPNPPISIRWSRPNIEMKNLSNPPEKEYLTNPSEKENPSTPSEKESGINENI